MAFGKDGLDVDYMVSAQRISVVDCEGCRSASKDLTQCSFCTLTGSDIFFFFNYLYSARRFRPPPNLIYMHVSLVGAGLHTQLDSISWTNIYRADVEEEGDRHRSAS